MKSERYSKFLAGLVTSLLLFSLVINPAMAAALTMAIVPIVLVYVNMQKQMVAGLTQGALKW